MSGKVATTLVILFLAAGVAFCRQALQESPTSSGKFLVARPRGRGYKTVLSLDGGGVRGIISAVVLIEVEQAVKRHILEHSGSHHGRGFSSVDDFDVNLVDFFDCMTGLSAGAWSVLYLASRGGHGASRFVLDDPAIVEEYGRIPPGGAEGLRVLYKEYSKVIYPAETLNVEAGTPFDLTNSAAPGVSAPLYSLDGLERTLEAFLGDSTLADLDTTVLVPALNLATGLAVYFVQNRFRQFPVTSSARLNLRAAPRSITFGFSPDFVFDEGKDYVLSDVGTASGATPAVHPAKSVSQVGTNVTEFVLVDGFVPLEATALPASIMVAHENGFDDFERIAVLSVGSGHASADLSALANAGVGQWLDSFTFISLLTVSGQETLATLMDYLYYGNPDVKPFQYVRIQTTAPVTSEEGMALSVTTDAGLVDVFEAIGTRVAEEHKESIDAFVESFIFG